MTVLPLVVAALLVGVVLVGVGDRLRLPWPVLLVLVGAAAAFVPGVDAPDLEPELILPLFLPPLLFATAQRASWAVFRARWRSVLFLAVLLVAVTIAAVGATVVWLVPGIALGAALAVGAAVAPPDPVAVEAVAGPLRMPRALVSVLAGARGCSTTRWRWWCSRPRSPRWPPASDPGSRRRWVWCGPASARWSSGSSRRGSPGSSPTGSATPSPPAR
jgi:hypothetical protein